MTDETTLYTGTSPLPVIEVGMRLHDGWGCVWRVVEVLDGGVTIGLRTVGDATWLPAASVRTWRLDEDWPSRRRYERRRGYA